jgi:hypothetical protein
MDRTAVGDGGNAVGILQIHKILVDDVNRILGGSPAYTYDDRWCIGLSEQMCEIYLLHYGKEAKTVYDLGRIWNGGPKGMSKDSTLAYIRKMEELINDTGKTTDTGSGQ